MTVAETVLLLDQKRKDMGGEIRVDNTSEEAGRAPPVLGGAR